MVVDEYIEQQRESEEQQAGRLWYYLVSLRGQLYAVPDEAGAVLMPHIGRLPVVTPLPRGLVRPYVLGLVNVSQRGEVAIDLAAFLGIAGEAAPDEQRCLLVIGESGADGDDGAAHRDPYRLAFAVDAGYELTELEDAEQVQGIAGAFVRALVNTRRGQASLLDMETICASIIGELGAERPWNAPAEAQT